MADVAEAQTKEDQVRGQGRAEAEAEADAKAASDPQTVPKNRPHSASD